MTVWADQRRLIDQMRDAINVAEAVCGRALKAQRDAEERASKLEAALRWYADPANNGPQEFVTIDAGPSADVPKIRPIDDDAGQVAREALGQLGPAEPVRVALGETFTPEWGAALCPKCGAPHDRHILSAPDAEGLRAVRCPDPVPPMAP